MIRSEVKQQTVGIEIARENDSSSRPVSQLPSNLLKTLKNVDYSSIVLGTTIIHDSSYNTPHRNAIFSKNR